MAVDLIQDIHLSDIDFWKQLHSYWDAGLYSEAISLLENNTQLATKQASADWFNNLANAIVELEENDPGDFKSDRIQVAYSPPTLPTGGVYFDLSGSQSINVYTGTLTDSVHSVSVTYTGTLINAIAFSNDELVKVDITYANGSVTFTSNSTITNIIDCYVYATASDIVTVTTGNISVGNTSVNVSYSDNIVNCYSTISNTEVLTNKTITSSIVTFTLAESNESAVACRVVSISNNNLNQYLNVSTGTITSSTTDYTIELPCGNYVVGIRLIQNGVEVLGNAKLDMGRIRISLAEAPTSSVSCYVYYI